MKIGDIVVRKSYGMDISFRIIDINKTENGDIYILKGINIRIVADAPASDLEEVEDENQCQREKILNRKVANSIRNIMSSRMEIKRAYRVIKTDTKKELSFGRPGKILHIDGDADYLEICMKVYKQLHLDVVGRVIEEYKLKESVMELIRTYKPDIVVITGHDAVAKNCTDYMDINNYRNSKYFIEAVTEIRNYIGDYDEMVIFAGACQSFYEGLLDAGANFASSPNRVLIHCLDPVFVCERIAYANIDKVVSIQEAVENTVTGIKGIGGLQTRGKYREGFPKSPYA